MFHNTYHKTWSGTNVINLFTVPDLEEKTKMEKNHPMGKNRTTVNYHLNWLSKMSATDSAESLQSPYSQIFFNNTLNFPSYSSNLPISLEFAA
jgi:hypothetical protein